MTDVPAAARILGFAGAVPFVAGALADLFVSGSMGDVVLLTYGAVILSFMGAIHWGAGMARGETGFVGLGASVVPALVAWSTLLIGGWPGLCILAASFALLLAYDLAMVGSGSLPAWYAMLRRPLTAIVVATLLVGAVG